MNDEHKLRDSDASDEELDREAIIKRRQRFMKASLGVLALSALGAAAEACACLSPPSPQDTGVTDAAQDVQGDVSGPQVCLSARPPDAESDAESDASASADGEATG